MTKRYVNVVISKRHSGNSQTGQFIDINMNNNNNNNVRGQVNTRSDLSIISENTWKKLVNRN